MRSVVWVFVGAFFGWRAWRLARRDIHNLRRSGSTFGEAFVADAWLTPWVWTLCGAVLWGLFTQRFDSDASVLVYGVWSQVLLRLLLIDVDTHVLPGRIIWFASTWGLLALVGLSIVEQGEQLWAMLGAAVVMWVVLKALEIVSRGDLGGGDVALGPLLAMFAGWLSFDRVFVVLIAAFILGGLFATVLVTLGRAGRRTFIAFGPFLIVGAFIGVLR